MTTTTIPLPAASATTTPFRFEVLTCATIEAFRALQPQWRALLAKSEAVSPFVDFAYAELAAERALANGAVVEVAAVYEELDVCVLWPVAIERRGVLRCAQPLGSGCGEEYGGPLIADTRRAEFYDAAVRAVRRLHADLLSVPMLEEGSALQLALAAAPQSWVRRRLPARWREMPGYAIGLRAYADWDDYLATRHSSLRAALRASLKRLGKLGHVSFDWCANAEEAHDVLTWLFANKRRWALARGIDSPYLMDDSVRDFFIELAQRIDLSRTPLVACVKVEGRPVAASVNLVGAQSVEYFITTYDEAFGTYSVGNLLVEFIAQWAHAHRRDFDFRPLHGDYKLRWADRHSRHESRLVVLRARGRLIEALLLARVAKRVGRKLLSIVRSRGKRERSE
ncbi:CelD/BcsL family acetyltransferase involved in cellulose biosynthesis [Paraburkholderia tropica]|uniref:GNAT family N-acetyltransferase n=1 Tax=Paraburkholderia tropica TaxID=92647 RepID=UPI001CAAA161|nr:GNAT family N-acetyltransferase [Paraburkholderia tropica]CAG9192869.1 CelD/BcsL family acetyltransferase involved in cellulose biosynthesis [Paraburkholderia tropica]